MEFLLLQNFLKDCEGIKVYGGEFSIISLDIMLKL